MKNLKEIVKYVEAKKDYYEMEIRVNYVINLLDEEVYVDIEVYKEGETVDKLNLQVSTFNNSKALAYGYAKEVEAYLVGKQLPAVFKKEVYR